jgi:SprT protein
MSEKEILSQYLPEAAVEKVYRAVVEHQIHLKITRGRKTKLGDYRPPVSHTNHRISINYDLNKYAFLITFVHELAHLIVFEQHKNRVAPHGKEWKSIYRELMLEYLQPDIFPEDILIVLKKSIQNSKASSTSDLKLSRILQQYDTTNKLSKVEELPLESVFETQNGRKFKKGEKVRTRYKCLNLQNNRVYLFHPLTPVVPID